MLVCCVVGARPNFMKMAPIVLELKRRGIGHLLVHTGQHYDANMSQVFFDELGMPPPDVHLNVGSASHAEQTAKVMVAFEGVCLTHKPTVVLAGGDVNSTMAAALVAAKLPIPFGHIESGLRSFDRAMPEEINRVVTDAVSTWLFTSEESANEHLLREGVAAERIHFVGNCMVDSLFKHRDVAVARAPWKSYGLEPNRYALVTLHRPSNVDDEETLSALFQVLLNVSEKLPVLFPVHPRTRARIHALGLQLPNTVSVCDPLPYVTFLGLMAKAGIILTDSGGIQEESTALQVPCLTLRKNTERPSTIQYGKNRLVGQDLTRITEGVDQVLSNDWQPGTLPPLWDGRAAERAVEVLVKQAPL